jgi:hypothetical protein
MIQALTAELCNTIRDLLHHHSTGLLFLPEIQASCPVVPGTCRDRPEEADTTKQRLRNAIREIGEELHHAGGIDVMHFAHSAVAAELPWPACALIDRLWSGVGDWL